MPSSRWAPFGRGGTNRRRRALRNRVEGRGGREPLPVPYRMKAPLRILHLEDDPADSELLRAMLEMDRIIAQVDRVDGREKFLEALDSNSYDIIISDYSMPTFDGRSALVLAREHAPHTPFILLSGTIGEEAAVEVLREGATDYVLKDHPERLVASLRRMVLREGATDYVLKDHPERLVASLRRALRESDDRRRRQQAEEALRDREEFFRLISENVTDLIAVIDLAGRRVYSSASYKNLLGDPAKLLGTDSFQEIHPDDRELIRRIFRDTLATGVGQRAEFRFMLKDGVVRYIESQ